MNISIKAWLSDINDGGYMIFKYKILNTKGQIVCTGKTIQVFLTDSKNLSLTLPPFFENWKQINDLP